MRILFLTMNNFNSISECGIYTDLMRELVRLGHLVTVMSPIERKYKEKTNKKVDNNVEVIKVRTGNLFNVNLFEKLISRAGICRGYRKAFNKYCKYSKFNVVIFSTPPTTLGPLVSFVKKRDGAFSYLMLKDIFPQNAVDLGLIRQNGIINRLLRIKEKQTYKIADIIGCMSPANMTYLKKHNPWIDEEKIQLCPNAIEVREETISKDKKDQIQNKYGIPKGKLVFIYGGGLGMPQGIGFLIDAIKAASKDPRVFFLIIGDGIFFDRLKKLESAYYDLLKVIKWLPTDEYNEIVRVCDVGLVLLNHEFTIPNFPSRVLNYMQAKLPILVSTDVNSDLGEIAEKNSFGYWCESNDEQAFVNLLDLYKDDNKRKLMGENAFNYLVENYNVNVVAERLVLSIKHGE